MVLSKGLFSKKTRWVVGGFIAAYMPLLSLSVSTEVLALDRTTSSAPRETNLSTQEVFKNLPEGTVVNLECPSNKSCASLEYLDADGQRTPRIDLKNGARLHASIEVGHETNETRRLGSLVAKASPNKGNPNVDGDGKVFLDPGSELTQTQPDISPTKIGVTSDTGRRGLDCLKKGGSAENNNDRVSCNSAEGRGRDDSYRTTIRNDFYVSGEAKIRNDNGDQIWPLQNS